MLSGNYKHLYNRLKSVLPDNRIYVKDIKTLAFGTDASFYRLTPQIVVKVINTFEVQSVIKLCADADISLTFRAAGTSLSGQAITDSVLVLLDRSWNKYKINEDYSEIEMEPALIGGFANLYLKHGNKKIGPDPASINSATIGGIAINNASGMTSGIKNNSYNTLKGMQIIFADGTSLNTLDSKSREDFIKSHPNLINGINKISREVKENKKLKEKISSKFGMKNTTGYSINALVDYDDPIDIISHLMIGSEGTLGFISNITLNTVDNFPHKASALLMFEDVRTACSVIPILQKFPVDAAEIMDRAALKSIEDKDGIPDYIKSLPNTATALLIETSAEFAEQLHVNIIKITEGLAKIKMLHPVEFSSIPEEYLKLWNVRKGLFPSVSKNRTPGTTVVIEDINFPTERLADAALDLQALFKKHNYYDSIIWGHALSGNLHFVFAQNFGIEEEVSRYKNFIEELTHLVIEKYNGSLKAEHGTGRNMAPYVKFEWGEDAYNLMLKIKELFDPVNILNPGVILNDDDKIHLKNLKPLPIANEIIDKCIECGFCENVCPSKNLTLTPRQRIFIFREISSLQKSNANFTLLKDLQKDFEYEGVDSCATDGLCEIMCPVDIDTGKLIKLLRSKQITSAKLQISKIIANNFHIIVSAVRVLLSFVAFAAKYLGNNFIGKTSAWLRKVLDKKIPLWNKNLPLKNSFRIFPPSEVKNKKVVYFPSCINRTMGISPNTADKETVTDVMQKLFAKADYRVIFPKEVDALCCGMPFASKGLNDQAEFKGTELLNALKIASNNGEYPIVYDMSPCTKTSGKFLRRKEYSKLKIYDSFEFVHDFLLKELHLKPLSRTIMLHPVCSVTKMGIDNKLKAVADKCAEKVIIPENISCCGFAGDKGFTLPELNQSALNELKESIPHGCNEGYSSSRTCEIGLSEQSGIDYKSIIYLVDEASN